MDCDNILRYSDEKDKSYGVAGMAIAVVAYDCEDSLSGISIDASADDCVKFGTEFYFIGNPRLSAKVAWSEILKHFRLGTGLLVANAMSRSYVQHRRPLTAEVQNAIRNFIHKSGAADDVQLGEDEIDAVFDRNIDFFDRLFRMQATHDAAHALAADLIDRRHLSAAETVERLSVMMRYL